MPWAPLAAVSNYQMRLLNAEGPSPVCVFSAIAAATAAPAAPAFGLQSWQLLLGKVW
jgi:hypothetical protein